MLHPFLNGLMCYGFTKLYTVHPHVPSPQSSWAGPFTFFDFMANLAFRRIYIILLPVTSSVVLPTH